ncbi:MAG: nucleoid-associated protein [Gammaproteobacteria bacterium]|nr:nucleoid-associated protein [Gammaproteobacteria bacterium]MBU2070824.1 nucleoid-associated protein [Gammaproteobacteria bacterium]MBU2182815.1 nucleoid-associated protein [Gammaproteobacteria bacterium]MBU2205943.1 nucleoid-associated protein [Gammaproteobacteria bacterium]
MDLICAVIHELVKEPAREDSPAIEAHYVEAENLLDVTSEPTYELVKSIQSLYGTKGNASSKGTFETNGAYTFPTQFLSFVDSIGDDDAFLALTNSAMVNLVEKAGSQNFATGGYVVFAYYQQGGHGYILAAMVKKRDGISLVNLEPKVIQEVDLSKIHQAIRINISSYMDARDAEELGDAINGAYLTFISPKNNKSASGYFITAFGCTNAIESATSTKNAIEAVTQFFERDERLEHLSNNAHDRVVELLENILTRDDKTCSIDEINHVVNSLIPVELADELNDTFVEFANNPPFNVPDSFYTHSGEIRKAKKVLLKDTGGSWSLNFEKRVFGTNPSADIQYCPTPDGGYITIRNLSDRIRTKIEEVLRERES